MIIILLLFSISVADFNTFYRFYNEPAIVYSLSELFFLPWKFKSFNLLNNVKCVV